MIFAKRYGIIYTKKKLRERGFFMNVISLLTPKAQVAYLYDDYTVRQGMEKFRISGYTALPVLSRDGMYLGTVTEGDFLWHMVDEQNNSLREHEKHPLKAVMRSEFNPPVSVRVTMDDLLDHAMRQSFIPVVDDREFLSASSPVSPL